MSDDPQPSNCSCSSSLVLDMTSIYMDKVTLPVVGVAGLAGNLAAIGIICRRDRRSTFHQSLITLAVIDILFVSIIICDTFCDTSSIIYVYMFPYFWNPLKNILMTWETFLMMSIATERFLAVCHPLVYRAHKVRHSPRVHMITYIIPSVIISIIINIPKFFETKFVTRHITNIRNITQEEIDFEITNLRLNPFYIMYYTHWTRLLCTGVIPFIFLSAVNLLINKKLKNSHFYKKGNRASFKNTQNSIKTLIAIVILYLICNIPRLSLNLSEYVLYPEISYLDSCGCSQSPIWVSVLVSVSNLFLVINSSANFIIYFSIGDVFKKVVHRSNSVLPHLFREQSACDSIGSVKCRNHNRSVKTTL